MTALGLSIVLCPESFVIVGNLTGKLGSTFIPCLTVACLLCLLTGFILDRAITGSGYGQLHLMSNTFGRLPAATIIIAARLSLVITASTAFLVTAGFTMNEVFLYWIPNFGVAFLLLAIITGLNIMGGKIALNVQVLFLTTTVLPLILLIGIGLCGEPAHTTTALITTAPPPISTIMLPALLFIGFELSYSPGKKSNKLPLLLVLGFGLLLFLLWSIVSSIYVDGEKLAGSTVPYMTTARRIWGDPGRYLMGVTIISGCCLAVNGLFIALGKIISELRQHSATPTNSDHPISFYPVIPAIAIGTMMLTGQAGEENLEIWLFGSMLIWLFCLASFTLTAGLLLGKQNKLLTVFASFMAAIWLIIPLSLIIFHPPRTELLIFSAIAFGCAASFALLLILLTNRRSDGSI